MSSINLDDLSFVINNFNTNIDIDLSLNDVSSNIVICNDLSVSQINGTFKKNIDNIFIHYDNSLNNTDSSLLYIQSKLQNFNNIDNSFIYIDNSINILESSYNNLYNNISNNYYNKIDIDNSINDFNNKINNIINLTTNFSGKKTFIGDLSLTGNIYPLANFIIDPLPDDNTGIVIIKGNLQIDGSNTEINSSQFDVNNKITLAKNSTNLSQASDSGIKVYNNTGPSILYKNASQSWNINTNLDISGKLNIQNNDFTFKINDDLSDNKLEIKMDQNKKFYIDGNLILSGNYNSNNNYINNNHNSTIYLTNIKDISNNAIYSAYDSSYDSSYNSSNLNANDDSSFNDLWKINKGFSNNGYNLYFNNKPYNQILNDNSNNISDFLLRYNILKLDSTDFSYITPNDNSEFYEVSNNKIIIKKDSNEKININIDLLIYTLYSSIIDIAVFNYDNINSNKPTNIIDSSQIDISNTNSNTNIINLTLSIDSINLNKNQCIGFGFLMYYHSYSYIHAVSSIYSNIENINTNKLYELYDISSQNSSSGFFNRNGFLLCRSNNGNGLVNGAAMSNNNGSASTKMTFWTHWTRNFGRMQQPYNYNEEDLDLNYFDIMNLDRYLQLNDSKKINNDYIDISSDTHCIEFKKKGLYYIDIYPHGYIQTGKIYQGGEVQGRSTIDAVIALIKNYNDHANQWYFKDICDNYIIDNTPDVYNNAYHVTLDYDISFKRIIDVDVSDTLSIGIYHAVTSPGIPGPKYPAFNNPQFIYSGTNFDVNISSDFFATDSTTRLGTNSDFSIKIYKIDEFNDISFNFKNIDLYLEKNSILNLLDLSVNNITHTKNTINSNDINVKDISINDTLNSNYLNVRNKVFLYNIPHESQYNVLPSGTIYYDNNKSLNVK